MRILFIAALMFFALDAASQANPSSISKKVLKGETFGLSLISPNGITLRNTAGATIIGSPDRNSIDLSLTPDQLGVFQTIIKYEENGQFFYTTINFEVVESIIEPLHDYEETVVNGLAVIDVLVNDYTSDGILEVTAIPYAQNGVARIVDGMIEFNPDPDFSGLAYLSYVATDSKGLSETGFATIHVFSDGMDLDKRLALQVGESLDIVVPSQITPTELSKTSLGKVSQSQFGVIHYNAGLKPGSETIRYSNGGELVELTIKILGKNENYHFLRDDVVHTTAGTSVQFDVFANDLEQNFPIVSKSPQLKNAAPNSGKFSYTPPNGFQGVEKFFYQVTDGTNIYVGNIEIIVDNFLPEIREYDFVTRMNTAFVLEYAKSTGNSGTFNFAQAPIYGTLRKDPNGFNYKCGSVLGENLLVYTPNEGYVGPDEFAVEYCSSDGSCVELDIIMDVVSTDNSCSCIGPDCTWPGDSDRDGRVSVKDLLPIGYYLGEEGSARDETGLDWNALHSSDWGEIGIESGKDIKNIDTNGDGIIDVSDVEALDVNYALLNSFVSRQALSIKNVPFYAIPRVRSAGSGDLVLIDLYIGTEDLPLLESNGLAFNFTIPPSYIKENSLSFDFAPEEWYGYNNPTIDFVKYPTSGRVEASITRTGRSSIDGYGTIGTFQIVLQEDGDGFKPESNIIPIEFQISGGEYVAESGTSYGLEDSKQIIYLELNNQTLNKEMDIVTYPNPTSNRLTIHANNQDKINNISLFNILGERIDTYKNVESNHFEIDTRHLPQGFYLAQIETKLGVSTEKIQIIKE